MRFFSALALASASLALASPADTTTQDVNMAAKETSIEKHATISTLLRMISGGRFELESMNAEQLTALEEVEKIIEGLGESFEEVTQEGGVKERRNNWHYSYYPVYRPRPHHHHHHGHGYYHY